MSEPDLLQRQRDALRAFCQASAQRAKAEAEAEARRKADLEAADARRKADLKAADARRAEALQRWQEGRTKLYKTVRATCVFAFIALAGGGICVCLIGASLLVGILTRLSQ